MKYTYLIGWSKLDKWYYGCRFAKNCSPDDLWVTYFTSSKEVKRYREKYGEPDIIQIRKKFKTTDKCRIWESKVLKRMNVINEDKWLNKTDNKAIINDEKTAKRIGKIVSAKQKKIWEEKLKDPNFVHPSKGRPSKFKGKSKILSDDHVKALKGINKGSRWYCDDENKKEIKLYEGDDVPDGYRRGRLKTSAKGGKLGEYTTERYNKGYNTRKENGTLSIKGWKHSEKTKRKLSETRKKKFQSGELIPTFLGKTHTKETKKKISESKKKTSKNL